MSVEATSAVWKLDLRPTAKLVALRIADHANAKREGDASREAWPSLNSLARDTGLSRSTVCRVLNDLEVEGVIRRLVRGGPVGRKATRYRLEWSDHGTSPTTGPVPPRDASSPTTGPQVVPPSDPNQNGTRMKREGEDTPAPDPVMEALLRAFPDAPPELSPPETAAFKAIPRHITDLADEDWLAVKCWNGAPDRIRGRKLWPRSRREFLENFGEAIEHIRKWWRKDGQRWQREQTDPPPKPRPAEPAEPADTLTTEEALAILNSPDLE